MLNCDVRLCNRWKKHMLNGNVHPCVLTCSGQVIALTLPSISMCMCVCVARACVRCSNGRGKIILKFIWFRSCAPGKGSAGVHVSLRSKCASHVMGYIEYLYCIVTISTALSILYMEKICFNFYRAVLPIFISMLQVEWKQDFPTFYAYKGNLS